MNILVTGSEGYIGTHLGLPGVDLKSGHDFVDVKGEYHTIVHLAAFVSVPESYNCPQKYLDNNVTKLSRFLANVKCQRFIFISTGGALYGDAHLATETDGVECHSPYAYSKFRGENLVRQACPNHVILRLANVYGGELTIRGEANVDAHFAQDNPIVVYGGTQTRDFIHIDTVCEAIRRALHGTITGTFNIGSGVETTILRIAQKYSQARHIPIRIEPERSGEAHYISLDPTKAVKAGLLDSMSRGTHGL